MNALSCNLANFLIAFLRVYTVVLLVYAVLSWIPDLRGSWSRYLGMVVEPVLMPLRRIIPPVGGLDLSFLVLLLALQLLIIPLIYKLTFNICYAGY